MRKIVSLSLILAIFIVSFISFVLAVDFNEKNKEITFEEKNNILSDLRNSDKIDKAVLDKLETEDKVRVIVQLDEGDIKTNDKLSKKASKIRNNQNNLFDLLDGEDYYLVYQYNSLNMLALDVSPKALDILEKSSYAKKIEDNKIYNLFLSESAPLIGANIVWNDLGYTGKGETVCVIDTGVNYTHPSLGGTSCSQSFIEETLTTPVESNGGVHPYPPSKNYEEIKIISRPGFSNIAVHFNFIGLFRNDYARIEIMDSENRTIQTIRYGANESYCVNQTDFWSVQSYGDTIIVKIISDANHGCYGFKIDKVRESLWDNCGDFVGGYDFVNSDSDPMDDKGHGTHVAGIITSDDLTYRGIAPDANIVAVKSCDSSGNCYLNNVLNGIDWCISNKNLYNISVMSLSLGRGVFSDYCDSESDSQALNEAVDNGIFVGVASGNDAALTGISAPACASKAASVGSVYDAYIDNIGYSSCSETYKNADDITCYTNRNNLLNFLAPGTMIKSTFRAGGFGDLSGTSMAAPHVAGLAALMLEANNTLAPSQIKQIMNSTGKLIYDSATGLYFSRINATAAVEAVIPESPPSLSITIEDSVNTLTFNEIDINGLGTPIENPLVFIVDSSVNYKITKKSNSNSFSGGGTLLASNLESSNISSFGPWEDYGIYEEIIFTGTNGGSHNLYNQLYIPEGTSGGDYSLDLIYKISQN